MKTLKISLEGNIWNDNFRKSRVPPDKLVAMVTLDNLGNQKLLFLMPHRLILKVTKFQLPPPKRFGTVVKNILGGHHAPPPMSNRVNSRRHRRIRFKGPWGDTGIHEWEKFPEEKEGDIRNFLNAEIDNFRRGGRNYDPFRQYEDREFPVDADIDSQLCDSFFDRFTGYVDQRVDVRHASDILVYAARWCIDLFTSCHDNFKKAFTLKHIARKKLRNPVTLVPFICPLGYD